MATHSSVLTWRIPGTGEPGGLPSVGSQRVGHDWNDLAAAAGFNSTWAETFQMDKLSLGKVRGTRDQIANIHWITEKARVKKNIYFCFADYTKSFDCVDHESEGWEWKSWLKTQYSKTKIMATSPMTSWQTDREKVETVADFIFFGSKTTVDGDWSHKVKRPLLLGEKLWQT